MDDFKPNSYKSKNESNLLPEKKIEKVVSGSVKSKKRRGLQRFADVFISEDIEDVKCYIFEEVIIPAVKDTILDAAKALLGVKGKSKNSTASKISYRSYYERENNRDYNTSRIRSRYDYDEVILNNRGEAEDVLSRMDELISMYGLVSVADFYDLVGITGDYTDNKYGWTNIRNASVIHVRDGYMIKLPKALPLN